MYDREQPILARYAGESPAAFARVCTFVLLTIRNPIEKVGDYVADVDAKGSDSRYLWGHKRPGFLYVNANAQAIYAGARTATEHGDDIRLMVELLQIPSLGMAKAGFLAQICFGRIGCLDTHNLTRFDLTADRFRLNGVSAATMVARIRSYVATCRLCGGSEELWNSWCRYVAALRPASFAQESLFRPSNGSAADAVSRIHVEALGLQGNPTL